MWVQESSVGIRRLTWRRLHWSQEESLPSSEYISRTSWKMRWCQLSETIGLYDVMLLRVGLLHRTVYKTRGLQLDVDRVEFFRLTFEIFRQCFDGVLIYFFQFLLQILRRRIRIFSHFSYMFFYFLFKVHVNFSSISFLWGLGLRLDHHHLLYIYFSFLSERMKCYQNFSVRYCCQ